MTERIEGRPNWKNQDDYPAANNTNMEMWAWEFMRRNREFLLEVEVVLDEQERLFKAESLPPEWSKQPLGAVLYKWGVRRPYASNPEWVKAMGTPMGFARFPRSVQSTQFEGDERRWMVCAEDRTRMVLEFDLLAPIGPQLTRAKAMLDHAKKSREEVNEAGSKARNNESIRLFPQYLRLLDAKTEGIGNAKLAEFFGLGDDTISKRIEKAESLRDGGYKALLEK